MQYTTSDFVAQKADLREGPWTAAMSSSLFDPGKIASKILPGLRGCPLFAYLFRRFGYPSQGWDDHKELVRYLLTTPMDKVFLEVRPYLGSDYRHDCPQGPDEVSVRLMFGYCISQHLEQQYLEELYYRAPRLSQQEREASALHQQYNKAFEATIRDLQRPVFVRDVPINCYGRIADSEFDGLPEEASLPIEAGYGIPMDFFTDLDLYDKFLEAVSELGNNDINKGMQWVIDAWQQKQGSKQCINIVKH